MWIVIAGVLVLIWLISFLALHVTSFLIHVLLILAVISLIVHFLWRRGA